MKPIHDEFGEVDVTAHERHNRIRRPLVVSSRQPLLKFFGELVEFITSGPLVAGVIEGEEAIAAWRTMMGATKPAEATPGSIRADLAVSMQDNVVHGSDSPASAAREIALFFPGLDR